MFPPVHDVIDIAGANHIPRLLVDDRQQGSQKRIRAAYEKNAGMTRCRVLAFLR